MKSFAGRLFWAAISLVILMANVSREWDRFIENHPGASGWDFVRASAPSFGTMILGIAVCIVLAVLIGSVASFVARWSAPPRNSPPPSDAGPLYALRTYPLHVGVCLVLVSLSLVTFFSWPVAAMVLIGLTIWSWVLLARRMGLEPPDDPAAPHNPSRI